MKIRILLIAFVMFGLFLSAGCTDSGSSQSSGSSGALTYTLSSEPVQHYSSDGTCYYRVDTVDVINNGATDAKNVVVRCNLIDPSTGSVVDTSTRYFELIEAGDHEGFSIELDGECGYKYELEVDISKDET